MQEPPPPPAPESDRSTLILVLGILSILVCALLGPFAWMMGRHDLRAIEEGRIDRKAEPLTRAGMICGIIGTIFLVVGVLAILFWLILIIIGAGAAAAGGLAV